MIHHPITLQTHAFLKNVVFLIFHEEATSLGGNSSFLNQLIHRWDYVYQAFKVGPNLWYHAAKEDIYFIIVLCRMGEDQPHFLKLFTVVTGENQSVYVQIYVSHDIVDSTNFQVPRGKLCTGTSWRVCQVHVPICHDTDTLYLYWETYQFHFYVLCRYFSLEALVNLVVNDIVATILLFYGLLPLSFFGEVIFPICINFVYFYF